MPTEAKPRPDTPEHAQAMLAMVQAMQAAGRRQGVWPRWTRWGEVLTMAMFLLAVSYSHWFVAIIGTGAAMLAFRLWCVKRFGALARWSRIDAMSMALVIALTFVVASSGWRNSANLMPLAAICVWAVSGIALDELKRRAGARRANGIDLA